MDLSLEIHHPAHPVWEYQWIQNRTAQEKAHRLHTSMQAYRNANMNYVSS
jgi:hypothetical protein